MVGERQVKSGSKAEPGSLLTASSRSRCTRAVVPLRITTTACAGNRPRSLAESSIVSCRFAAAIGRPASRGGGHVGVGRVAQIRIARISRLGDCEMDLS